MSRIDPEEVERLYWEEGMTQEEIAKKMNSYQSSIYRCMKRNNIPTRKKYDHLLKSPDLSPTPTLSYIVGVVEGDGGVIKDRRDYKVRMFSTSKEFIESFKNSLEEMGLNTNVCVCSSDTCKQGYRYLVKAFSKEFYNWYKKLSTSDIEELALKNKEHAKSFVRGAYESEGSVWYDKRNGCKLQITNTDEKFVEVVEKAMKKIGFEPKKYIHEEENGKDLCRLYLSRYASVTDFLERVNPCIKGEMEKGDRSNTRWTEREVETLKEKYPKQGSNIPALLETRSRDAITGKAKIMGIEYGG